MFMKFLFTVIVLYGFYYGVNVLYDIYMAKRRYREDEDVIIDITGALDDYKPQDADEVVRQESRQNAKERTGSGQEEGDSEGEEDADDDDQYESIEDAEKGDDVTEQLMGDEDEEDVAPLNMCGGYTPLEFKKLLEDAYSEPNAFAGIDFESA